MSMERESKTVAGLMGSGCPVKISFLLLLVALLLAGALAEADPPGPVPKAATLANGLMAAVPFEIEALKRNWRRRIEAMRSAGELPIIDIESSFDVSAFDPSDYARAMDEYGIALIAFSPQGRSWTDSARVVVALDPWRYIPTTTAGVPPLWPKEGKEFLEKTARQVRSDRYPLMGEFEFRHYPSPRQLGRNGAGRDIEVALDGPLGHALFRLSEETLAPFQIHYEIEDRLLPPLEAMLKQYPKARVIWCHLAQIRYRSRSAIYGPAYVRRLIESFPNLYFDTAFGGPNSRYPASGEFHATIWDRGSGGIQREWGKLISDHPWRFLAALDVGGDRMDRLGEQSRNLRRFLDALPSSTRAIVAYKGAWRLLFNEDI